MEIQLEGQYTQKEIRQIAWRRFSCGYKALALLMSLGVVFNLMLFVPAVATWLMGPLPFFPTVLSALSFLALAGLLWSLPWLTARQLAKFPLFQDKVTGAVTGETVTLTWAQGEATVRWELFQYCKMWDDMVVLYENPSTMTPLPRSFFASDDDWQRLRQFIQDTLPAKPPKSGSFLLRWPGRLLIYFLLLIIVGVLAFLFASTP